LHIWVIACKYWNWIFLTSKKKAKVNIQNKSIVLSANKQLKFIKKNKIKKYGFTKNWHKRRKCSSSSEEYCMRQIYAFLLQYSCLGMSNIKTFLYMIHYDSLNELFLKFTQNKWNSRIAGFLYFTDHDCCYWNSEEFRLKLISDKWGMYFSYNLKYLHCSAVKWIKTCLKFSYSSGIEDYNCGF
jgi:hypothetical protein